MRKKSEIQLTGEDIAGLIHHQGFASESINDLFQTREEVIHSTLGPNISDALDTIIPEDMAEAKKLCFFLYTAMHTILESMASGVVYSVEEGAFSTPLEVVENCVKGNGFVMASPLEDGTLKHFFGYINFDKLDKDGLPDIISEEI